LEKEEVGKDGKHRKWKVWDRTREVASMAASVTTVAKNVKEMTEDEK